MNITLKELRTKRRLLFVEVFEKEVAAAKARLEHIRSIVLVEEMEEEEDAKSN